ncbi:hypothetical protein ACJMK2_040534, partial [Sinanodonta woodiana]
MDSCDDDLNFPDDIIDTVAKANCAKVEPSSILPEIRASPCQIHTKRDRKTDLNVSTNHHFGKVPDSSKKKQSSVQPVSLYKDSSHGMNITVRKTVVEIPTDKDGRESENFQVRKRPALPKHMSSKEYVMSWLIHGSAPNGTNHFPDILPSDKTSKHRSTPRKS